MTRRIIKIVVKVIIGTYDSLQDILLGDLCIAQRLCSALIDFQSVQKVRVAVRQEDKAAGGFGKSSEPSIGAALNDMIV